MCSNGFSWPVYCFWHSILICRLKMTLALAVTFALNMPSVQSYSKSWNVISPICWWPHPLLTILVFKPWLFYLKNLWLFFSIRIWLSDNFLKLKLEKTVAMFVGSAKLIFNRPLTTSVELDRVSLKMLLK